MSGKAPKVKTPMMKSITDLGTVVGTALTLANPGLGAMATIAGRALKKGGTQPKKTTDTNKKKKKEAVGVSYDPAQLGKKNMRVGRLSKGGMVSHKSVFDLE